MYNSTTNNNLDLLLTLLRKSYEIDTHNEDSPNPSKYYVNIKLKNSPYEKIYKIYGFNGVDNEYKQNENIGDIEVRLIPLWEIKKHNNDLINEKINQLNLQITQLNNEKEQLNNELNEGVKTNIPGEIGIQLKPNIPINIPINEIESVKTYNKDDRWWKDKPNYRIWGGKHINKKTKTKTKTKKIKNKKYKKTKKIFK